MDCPPPPRSNVTDVVQIFYSPYANQRYSVVSDTVDLKDFRYNFELDFTLENEQATANMPRSLATSCLEKYDVRNISNLQIFLTTGLEKFSPGTDISYLFTFQDGTQLNRYRDFTEMKQFNSLQFTLSFTGQIRLNTRLIIFLKNGEQLVMISSSPIIRSLPRD